MKNTYSRLRWVITFFLLVLFFFCAVIPPATVFAGDNSQEFEYQETEENLYEYRNITTLTLIRFYEYGYGSEEDYSLYFYVYNPDRINIATDTRNVAQIGYCNKEKNVFKVKYSKYMLVKDGQSETGLFVRFKISGLNMPTDKDRFYCFSGLELVTNTEWLAKEYPVSAIYHCTTSNGKTTISTETLPTCEVEVNHTYYRTNYSDKGRYWRNQLSMCYFAIPENLSCVGSSGTLEALTAEFNNYYTKHIYITSGEERYAKMKELIGVNREEQEGDSSCSFRALQIGGTSGGSAKPLFQLYYGKPLTDASDIRAKEYINTLYWVLYDKIEEDEPALGSEDYLFSGDNLRTYFNDYAKKYSREKAISDLFITASEYKEQKLGLSGFDYGYNKHTYSIAEKPETDDDVFGFGLKFDDAEWYESLFGISSSETKKLLPLVKIEAGDLYLSDEKFSEKYYVEESEVSNIKAFIVEQSVMNKETWILRYDTCEYFAVRTMNRTVDELVAQESVYLDFDILSFRFAQGDSKYTIAVNMSPQDVFNDLTGTKQPLSWWEKLLQTLRNLLDKILAWIMAIIFVIVGVILIKILIEIFKLVLKIDNTIIKVIMVILCSVGTIFLGYYYIKLAIWVVEYFGGLW